MSVITNGTSTDPQLSAPDAVWGMCSPGGTIAAGVGELTWQIIGGLIIAMFLGYTDRVSPSLTTKRWVWAVAAGAMILASIMMLPNIFCASAGATGVVEIINSVVREITSLWAVFTALWGESQERAKQNPEWHGYRTLAMRCFASVKARFAGPPDEENQMDADDDRRPEPLAAAADACEPSSVLDFSPVLVVASIEPATSASPPLPPSLPPSPAPADLLDVVAPSHDSGSLRRRPKTLPRDQES